MFIKHTRKHSLSETWQNLHSPFARVIPCNFVYLCAIGFLQCKLNFDMPSLIVRSACSLFFVLILSETRPSNCYAAIVAHLPLYLPSSFFLLVFCFLISEMPLALLVRELQHPFSFFPFSSNFLYIFSCNFLHWQRIFLSTCASRQSCCCCYCCLFPSICCN